jgi:hypothetical protein
MKFTHIVGSVFDALVKLTSDDRALLVVPVDATGSPASGSGGAGGGSIIYSNMAGDFIATPTVGAKTLTITGLPYTLEAGQVALGTAKVISSSGAATPIPLTNVQVSGGVITLTDMESNFATGDTVAIMVIGPDKTYDKSLDVTKVVNQNPEYAHTTSVESTIDEANIAGATAASDAGGDTDSIIDADAAFSVASVAVGYLTRNVTESASVNTVAVVSATEITTATVTSWSGDTYRLPLVKRYEVNMDTYKAVTAHYRLTNDANCTAYLKLYATNDASATVDADTNWVDVSATYLASALGWSAGDTAIKRAASGTTESIITIAPAGPYLKFMFKLVVECTIATAPANAFKLFTKKF